VKKSESRKPSYSVGIDLGTTNCAVSFLEFSEGQERASPRVFPVPQVIHEGQVAPRPLLPSFFYVPHASELPAGALKLPWDEKRTAAVGEFARDRGALVPVRLVSSAKSWLSHPALDRRAANLPIGSPDDVPKISPLDASARYLAHIREAWNAQFAGQDDRLKLEHQDITLTVPASFDAVARELTVEAAARAGIAHLTLLEEPQAALYAWVEAMGDRWRKSVKVADLILVCDVGGGTTDFSLIAVVDQGGDLTLQRVAVGDHILLGGDNMDLTLAHLLQQKLLAANKKIDSWQFLALTHAARAAKEALFGEPAKASHPVAIPGRGSSLVGGTIKTELSREELDGALVDGFFPRVDVSARPAAQKRVGLTTIGLPYAADPGVTRHLAAFLSRHRESIDETAAGGGLKLAGQAFLHPTAVLFNGGVMKATALKARVLEVISSWVASEGGVAPNELPGSELDLAVAHGRGLLRKSAGRQGHPDSRRDGTGVLRGNRDGHAGGAWDAATAQGAVPGSDGNGRRDVGCAAGRGSGARGGRARAVSVLRLVAAARGQGGRSRRGL
jgi:hypothetical protein